MVIASVKLWYMAKSVIEGLLYVVLFRQHLTSDDYL